MKLTLNIPESLSEVTLDQYQQWLKVAEDKEMNNFLQQKMIEIFCGVTLKQVMLIKAKDIEWGYRLFFKNCSYYIYFELLEL